MTGTKSMGKVSVIIPCYNSAPYLGTCMDSVLAQHYPDIEIVCVDDGSTDDTPQLLAEYARSYSAVTVVSLPANGGLFAARIAGAQRSTGDYIAFVDSDDRISSDWIGALIGEADRSGADLVFGDMRKTGRSDKKHIDPNREYYQNLDPVMLRDIDTDGMGMLDEFLKAHGLCSQYHYVWNKLISRGLWEACLDDLARLDASHGHLVMGEDIAFSATLFCHASHVRNVHHENYVYCVHDSQSVNTSDLAKFDKNVRDLAAVFDYLDDLVARYAGEGKYADELLMFRRRYGIIYRRMDKQLRLPKKTMEKLDEIFATEGGVPDKEIRSEYFFSLVTNAGAIDDVWRDLVDELFSDDVKVVSFDVFDTLVVRPFSDPADIFVYLNKPFTEIFGAQSFVDFSSLRRAAENKCHKVQKALYPGREEPTLDDIYDMLAADHGYDREKLRELERIETDNEVRFAYPREWGVRLFELAKRAGKRVILTSDMYLPESCLNAVLSKCGITGHEKLYLSSTYHLTKHSGRLYRMIARELAPVAPSQIYHIGDNYHSDVERAREAGWRCQHFPGASGLLRGLNPGIYTGRSFEKIFHTADRYTDMSQAYYGCVGMRSLLGIVANKMFDFPFVSFNAQSDLNGDPRFVGYYAVGMHVYSVVRWLVEKTRGKGVRTIHFVARDGYLIKKAYEILTEGMADVPSCGYVRLSRKAFAIADIGSRVDMDSLVHKLNFAKQSPDTLFDMFRPVMTERARDEYLRFRASDPAYCETFFYDRPQFDAYVRDMYDKYLSDADLAGYREELREYFSGIISPNDVIFDIGYSGRVELALNRLLGFRIRSFYIHTNNDSIDRRKSIGDFENETFYDHKPVVTGIIREHILSEMCPSAIGYEQTDEGMRPVFEPDYRIDYPTHFATELVQNSALEFVTDVKKHFGADALDLFCRNSDVSRPFEYYMHFSRSFDRMIFADSDFEDDFGEGHSLSGLDYWNRALARIHSDIVYTEPKVPSAVMKKPRWMRAIYFFLFDRSAFKRKLRRALHKKKG